jgi:hypothetical protein
VASGAVAGMLGGGVMNLVGAALGGRPNPHGAQTEQRGRRLEPTQPVDGRPGDVGSVDATEGMITRAAGRFGVSPPQQARRRLGTVAHYAFSTVCGAAYGLGVEYVPVLGRTAGAAFGMFVWVVFDEGLMPTLGLSPPPTRLGRWTHLYSVASHLAYGMTTHLCLRFASRHVGGSGGRGRDRGTDG